MRSRHSTWIQWESNYVIGWLACFVTCPRQPISYWCKHWCKSTDKQGDDLNRHRIPSPFTDTCWLCHVSEYKFQFILIEDTNPPCMITVNSTTQCNFTPLLLLSVGCLWWAGWYWLPSVCLFVWVLQSKLPFSTHMWRGDITLRPHSHYEIWRRVWGAGWQKRIILFNSQCVTALLYHIHEYYSMDSFQRCIIILE